VRHRDRLVGPQKQPDQADHHQGPGHGGLARRGAQRTEAEHHEQVAEKQHADFRREISEREQEHRVDGGLGRDKIVIAEALVDTQFREQHVERNESQSAESVGWGQRNGHRPGIGVGQRPSSRRQLAIIAWIWRRCRVRRASRSAVSLGCLPSSSRAIGLMNDAAVSMVSPLLELCGKIYGESL
jgi:hypothetical protein